MADQLFIGRLPRSTRSRELEDIFYKYGRMTRCDVKQGVKMSYGFIEYEDMRDAEDAIHNEHGREMGASRIVVEWARGPKYDYRRDRERHKPDREFRDSRRDRSKSRDRARRRSRSYDKSYKRRSRSRSYERRKSRSRSRDRRRSRDQRERRSRSRSEDYSRNKRRSRSRSEDYRRSRSKSQDHSRERKRSRSRSVEQDVEGMSRSRSPSDGDRRNFHSKTPDEEKGRDNGKEKSQSRSPYSNSHGDVEPED